MSISANVTLNLFQGPFPVTCQHMVRERRPCVYILASRAYGTLYIGITSDLPGRLWQHRNSALEGFTERYSVKRLVWFEMHGEMASAIAREKQLKNWRRQWKINLIESKNPHWTDLAIDMGFPSLDTPRSQDGP